jgi:ATP phosphoribosyltransferase
MTSSTSSTPSPIRFGLPKGRMQDQLFKLLADAGMHIRTTARGYRPILEIPGLAASPDTKILKPQNIIEMLAAGSRDLGFAGGDWVAELNASVVELFDTGLDPVRVVAAAPTDLLVNGFLPRNRRLVIASEYDRLTRAWIAAEKLDAAFVRSFGATEVFPPEDADCIVDVAATGATLEANNLRVFAELTRSSTRLYANPRALEDPAKRRFADDIVTLLKSVLEARKRVMIEVNVSADRLEAVCKALPCMREPTISQLHAQGGYAVKAAVPRATLAKLLLDIKAAGGTDIAVSGLSQIVP